MLVRKLYIDSRARTSGDDSDFNIALKTNIQCPGQCRAYVDKVFLCNVFGAVDETRDLLVWKRRTLPTTKAPRTLCCYLMGTTTRSAWQPRKPQL